MVTYTNELCHFGVKGMRWGVRRYQNADGSLTAAGKRRYHDRDMAKVDRIMTELNRDVDRGLRLEGSNYFDSRMQERISEISDITIRHGKEEVEKMLVQSVFKQSLEFDHKEPNRLVFTPNEQKLQTYADRALKLTALRDEELKKRGYEV